MYSVQHPTKQKETENDERALKSEMKPTRPLRGRDDPYAQFANEGGPGILGKLFACRKGDWGIGSEADPRPARRASSLSFRR